MVLLSIDRLRRLLTGMPATRQAVIRILRDLANEINSKELVQELEGHLQESVDPAQAERLTVSDLAAIFGVEETTVRRWIQRGELAGARKEPADRAKRWVVPRPALEDFTPPRRLINRDTILATISEIRAQGGKASQAEVARRLGVSRQWIFARFRDCFPDKGS